MKIERAGDLIYWTYFMIDWEKAKQEASDKLCQECGQMMNRVEPMSDQKGSTYDGYVCHKNKLLIWVKSVQTFGCLSRKPSP